ncbi:MULTISPECIES: hypothetical protein [Sutcliffiella]|nr:MULTISPECIES: hypothetical protein [Sutcliffiella]WBL14774.1 hypothetical protein O1A01_23350 [Sutcliffiella sp. NC1]
MPIVTVNWFNEAMNEGIIKSFTKKMKLLDGIILVTEIFNIK